jgi:hypothetical protein
MSSQALAAGLSSFGSSIGQGFQNYTAGRERRELLSGEAQAIYSELADLGVRTQSQQKMFDKLQNAGDMGTRELQGIISEYDTQEKMDQLKRAKKIQQFQFDKLQYEQDERNRAIVRDKAVSDAYGKYSVGSTVPVNTQETKDIPAQYREGGEFSPTQPWAQNFNPNLDEYGVPKGEGFKHAEGSLGSVAPSWWDENQPNQIPESNPIFNEVETAELKLNKVNEMKSGFVKDVNKAIDEQNIKSGYKGTVSEVPFARDFAEAKRFVSGEKLVNDDGKPTDADIVRFETNEFGNELKVTGKFKPEFIKPIQKKMKGLSDMIESYSEEANQAQGDVRNKLFDYMPASGDLNEAANAYALNEKSNTLPPVNIPVPDSEPEEPFTLKTGRELVSPERQEEYTVSRPKTAVEKEELLQQLIAERASDLGAKGIKSLNELTKNTDLQIVELGGSNYVFSPKSGSFQAVPKDKKEAEDAANQIAILGKWGLLPEEATVKLPNGTTVKLTMPSPENGGPKTESQAKAFLHAGSMKMTGSVIDEMTGQGFDASRIDNAFELYHNQNAIKSPEAKRYAAAMNKWLEAYLRHVSGAAIAKHEYEGARQQFFPVVNDGQDAINDKKKLREGMFSLMEQVSGGKVTDDALRSKAKKYELKAGETLSLVSDSANDAASEAEKRGLKSGDTYIWIDPKSGKSIPYKVN